MYTYCGSGFFLLMFVQLYKQNRYRDTEIKGYVEGVKSSSIYTIRAVMLYMSEVSKGVAKRSHASEASNLQLGSRAHLRALEAFGFLMLKYAFSHILETLFLSFLTSILTPKVDKNRTLEFTSINLRHSCILHLFFNLNEKVML